MPVFTEARRLASPALREIFVRRIAECFAIFLALAGIGVLAALATYNSLDPSLNTATSRHASNLIGPPGAMIADALLQSFGLAGALPGLALIAWAWRIGSHRGLTSPPLRIAALLAAMPALGGVLSGGAILAGAAMRARLANWPTPTGLGGAGGGIVALDALSAGGTMAGIVGLYVVLALGTVLAAALTVLAFGLSSGEWRSAGHGVGNSARGARNAAGLAGRIMRRIGRAGLGILRRINGMHRDEADLSPRTASLEAFSAPPAPTPATTPRTGGRWLGGLSTLARGKQQDRREPTVGYDIASELAGLPGMDDPAPEYPPPVVRASDRASDEVLERAPDRSIPLFVPPPPAPPQKPRVSAPASVTKNAAARQESLPLEGPWRFPPLSLLKPAPSRASVGAPSEEALQANARLLETVLGDYGVQGRIVEIRPGPVVTLYELEPAPGIRSARVIGLADDVARSLSVTAVRIATVSGRNVIGIEVPNAKRETVFLSELLGSEEWAKQQGSGRLALALGKDISGAPVVADLARMPHLLVAGTTGSGKSVGINAMILSLLFRMSPDQCRLILIDPKMLELSVYEGIPHLMAPVVTEPAKAVTALKWTVREMERRYRAMSQLSVRNIGGYNDRVHEARAKGEVVTRRVQTGFDSETGKPLFEEQPLALEPLPFIVVVIDEMADLMMVAGKEIEQAVQRLAQMARAAGIHVVMATQRPSVDVITGTIKANFPTRISFQVISKFDSRTILGEQGSEQLLGMGDMLYMVGGGRITRVHGPYVDDKEVEEIVAFLRSQGEPAYVDDVTQAPELEEGGGSGLSGIAGASDGEKGLFDQAVDLVSREGKASTSFIQRHLQIGYNRAAKLIEQMEKEGIVSGANHVGKREVLVRRTEED